MRNYSVNSEIKKQKKQVDLAQLLKSGAKYYTKSNNFIDVLQPINKTLKEQDKFYKVYSLPEEYPKKTIWDDEYWKSANNTIREWIGDIKGKVILDIGSGTGMDTAFFLKKGALVISLDSSEECLLFSQKINSNLHIRADATDLSFFEDGYFDIVFGREVLHHLDAEKCLKEVLHILKNGGFAVFQESLKYNPLIAVFRILKRKERVKQHPFAPNELQKISEKYFKKQESKHFYTILPLFYAIKFFFPRLTRIVCKAYSQFRKIDEEISNRFPLFAWEEIIKVHKDNWGVTPRNV